MSGTPAHHTVAVNGVTYHAAEAGQGPALLLLHGFTGSHANWRELMTALAPVHRVIAVDLLGHGQTDAPADAARYAMPRAAADLVEVAAALGAETFHLLGYSMGGRLALFTALNYSARVRSLLLESASPGLPTADERAARVRADQALAASIERDGITAFVDRWEALPLFASQTRLPADIRTRVRTQRLGNNPTGLANSLRGMGTGAQPSLWPRLHDAAMPTLLITGADDVKFCAIARQMAAAMPHAQHVTVTDAGHTVHLEQPGSYMSAVTSFLKKQRASRR